ncbi:MAG: TetR/AcrR family transcriptional regulator [Clostridia bacterium]|nr:TetR/AcrR family transcriptional regulator [Clostridia bacterium]
MAKRVEGRSDELMGCARDEFMEMGFREASLRMIAAKAHTSTGSIYTRFGDKEGLFRALVDPAAEELIDWFQNVQERFDARPTDAKGDVLECAKDDFDVMLDFIYDHYEAFKLLTRCADIDCYEKMLDRLVEIDNEYTYRFMRSTGHDPVKDGRLSPELLHMLSSAFYAGLFETVRHDMPLEQARTYVRQLRRFFISGWADLLQM